MASAFHETNLQLGLQLPRRRHGGGHRRLDLGLRARHRGRQPVAQLPHHRSRGVRGRQAREPALRQPLRHGAEVRGRDPRRRKRRLAAAQLPRRHEARSGLLRLPALQRAAEDRVAERRARRVLGGAEHRVLRARPAEESDARLVAAAGAGRARLLVPRLRQPRRLLAHDGGDGALRRARQRLAQRRGVRAPSRGDQGLRRARLGVLLARHLQHALHLQHERGAGARAHPGLDRHHPQAHRAEARRLARARALLHRAARCIWWPRWASPTSAISSTTTSPGRSR